ncbi:MAG: zf-HC2 domain-containing protein [Candidatus Eremiobacteraeota bacterium]|nr:zf-HC2 domain-containing protein [Candidatus Eremiobacteraeota bacterium]MBV9699402.1 zf-HC2 domain-containing protein [Candidatus Eremiobacteraeota bacterium]
MIFGAHVGDAAELYAAGALTAEEHAAVEAHIAQCSECLRRVGEAEETVLALERVNAVQSLRPSNVAPFGRRRVPVWWIPVAAAAALIVGLLVPRHGLQTDVATVAMLHSHFAHAQFVGNGPPAKVLYARDRSWYYVIVDGRHSYGVYALRDGASAYLGATQSKGRVSELFSSVATPFDRLELRDGGRLVEAAAIR